MKGRNWVRGPSSRVVICTSRLLMAKCTKAPLGKESRGSGVWPAGLGLRSVLYCHTASAIDWVLSVLSSPVATGMPLRNNTRSRQFSLRVE